MRNKIYLQLVLGITGFVLVAIPAGAKEGFPLREKYPDVKYMTVRQLGSNYGKTIIIDVRSTIEYNVIHINTAEHIPVARADFTRKLQMTRGKEGTAPIAFYCNGHTCAKSYKATRRAMKNGFKNVYAFDAGIYDWANAHPEKTTLLGETPAPQKKLIPDEMFERRKIGFANFRKKAERPNAFNIDIREPFQRREIPPIPKLRNIPPDRLVKLLEEDRFKDKELLILDAVGKQVRWLQYYLEKYGYRDYYFLSKGVLSAKKAGAVK